jgi:hypothetical protein
MVPMRFPAHVLKEPGPPFLGIVNAADSALGCQFFTICDVIALLFQAVATAEAILR